MNATNTIYSAAAFYRHIKKSHRLYKFNRHINCNKENISNILKDTCVAYKMDFNIKNLLDVGCTQIAGFRLVSLISYGQIA